MGSRGHEVPSHACPFDKGIRGPNDVATAMLPTRRNQFKSISPAVRTGLVEMVDADAGADP